MRKKLFLRMENAPLLIGLYGVVANAPVASVIPFFGIRLCMGIILFLAQTAMRIHGFYFYYIKFHLECKYILKCIIPYFY